MSGERLTGDRRCWPCTVANAAVGLLVGWLPVAAAVVEGSPSLITGTVVWGLSVTVFTVYRLLRLGYLPFAEPVARRTGLHRRIGPGSSSESEEDRGR
jgi:hypothetical protein